MTVLGRTAARELFDEEPPVGRRMRISDGQWHTVVGVAPDLAMLGLGAQARARIQHFRPLGSSTEQATFAIRLAPGAEAGAVLGAVRSLLRAEDPDLLVGTAAPVDTLLRDSVAGERFTSTLLTTFALLALILAAVGLYGVVSQVVGQRTREIGIRISLGAGGAQIRRLVLRGGALATGTGILVGIALAVGGLRLLSSQLFGLEEGGFGAAGSYAAAAVLLAAVTLAACWVPARRASRVDPVEALRVE